MASALRSLLLPLVGLVACAPDPVSLCHAPAPYAYAGTLRPAGQLPRRPLDALALPGGRVFAVTADYLDPTSTWQLQAYVLDPAAGAVDEVARWEASPGPMTRLRDGRILFFDSFACGYTLLDLDAPASPTHHTCTVEHVDIELMWHDPRGDLLLFGTYYPGGNNPEGAVFTLDLAAGALTRVGGATEHGVVTPPNAPFPLCDGRLVLPHTEFDGGDYYGDAEAVHYYDPATEQFTSVDLPFAPDHAAQLDASTALLLSIDGDPEPLAYILDLDTQAVRPVAAPDVDLPPAVYTDPLVGLADGGALTVAADRTLLRYDPAQERFTALDLRFAADLERLVRLSTGPVLAFEADGRLELYE
jgi:hypothetical protein